MRIRPIDSFSIAEVIRIAEETNLSPWSAQNYLDELKNPDSIMLRLVTDENRTIGFIVGRVIDGGTIEVATEAEIYNIAVSPDRFREGKGQVLFDAFLEACDPREVQKIWLEVRESNHPAISFYEKNGFGRVQTRTHFYSNPRENALLMCLDLSADGSSQD